MEKYEAGIVLTGGEVKALRQGKCSLKDSFAKIEKEEAWVYNIHIGLYDKSGYATYDPKRKRKLLLHKKEIKRLLGKTTQKGLTLIPLKIYFNNKNIAKVELALARGKKLYDKRQTIKQRDIERRIRNYKL